MKYLSRITVDHLTAARQRLNDSYAWHKALWRAFPEIESRKFLYRIETSEAAFRVYLLSEQEPKAPDWGRWETKPVSDGFLKHPRFRFRLCANPTRRYLQDGRGIRFEKGKRFVVADPDALKKWLSRKGELGGFAVEEQTLQISPPISQPFYKDGRKGNHKRVEFSGVLNVTDTAKFTETFNHGIGSAKAFGFGLLVLQPV